VSTRNWQRPKPTLFFVRFEELVWISECFIEIVIREDLVGTAIQESSLVWWTSKSRQRSMIGVSSVSCISEMFLGVAKTSRNSSPTAFEDLKLAPYNLLTLTKARLMRLVGIHDLLTTELPLTSNNFVNVREHVLLDVALMV
jgi:hypothetical protein